MGYILEGFPKKDTSVGIRYKCPCCRNYTFKSIVNLTERCPVCFWMGLKKKTMTINKVNKKEKLTLDKAQWTYYGLGVCHRSYLSEVRIPKSEEKPNICDEARNLTDDMYLFLYNEFHLNKESFINLSEDELWDYYEVLCDIEVEEVIAENMERADMAADIVTILGDVAAPIRNGYRICDEEI